MSSACAVSAASGCASRAAPGRDRTRRYSTLDSRRSGCSSVAVTGGDAASRARPHSAAGQARQSRSRAGRARPRAVRGAALPSLRALESRCPRVGCSRRPAAARAAVWQRQAAVAPRQLVEPSFLGGQRIPCGLQRPFDARGELAGRRLRGRTGDRRRRGGDRGQPPGERGEFEAEPVQRVSEPCAELRFLAFLFPDVVLPQPDVCGGLTAARRPSGNVRPPFRPASSSSRPSSVASARAAASSAESIRDSRSAADCAAPGPGHRQAAARATESSVARPDVRSG